MATVKPGKVNRTPSLKNVKVGKGKLELTTEILENILTEEGCDYFSFFGKTSLLLKTVADEERKDFAKSLGIHLTQYKSGTILKTVHMLQDIMLMKIQNLEAKIFGGGLSFTDTQIQDFKQLFFCTAADQNMQIIFELDLRYFKTVEMTGEVIRSKVLSVERALYPFLFSILQACTVDTNDISSNRVTKCLQVLESVSLAKEHSVDKLDNTVGAYSFLSLALCICLQAYEDKIIDIDEKKFRFLNTYLAHQSRNLSFNRGRENVKAFEDFVGHAFDCIAFQNKIR